MADAEMAGGNVLQCMFNAVWECKGIVFSGVIFVITMITYWISLQSLNIEEERGNSRLTHGEGPNH